jgi:hypothetical protein
MKTYILLRFWQGFILICFVGGSQGSGNNVFLSKTQAKE